MLKFALAGNPNCGKTTLFNALTGSTAHVGNWPGVTVDKREGVYKKLPEQVEIVDLPGKAQAAREALHYLMPELVHAVKVIKGDI